MWVLACPNITTYPKIRSGDLSAKALNIAFCKQETKQFCHIGSNLQYQFLRPLGIHTQNEHTSHSVTDRAQTNIRVLHPNYTTEFFFKDF